MPSRPSVLEGLRLLGALVSPFSTRESLLADWPATPPWQDLLAQADKHRLIPALHVTLVRHGLLDRVDAELAELLAAVADWNAERNEGFRRQMRTVSAAFNAAGLEPVWLKGALTLLPPEGPAAGRQMMDLDVWLPQESAQRAAMQVLRGLGYVSEGPENVSPRHFPGFFHPDEMARIELHHSVVAPYEALLPDDEAAQGVEWLDWEGLRIGQLDPMGRLLCSLQQCTDPRGSWLGIAEIPLVKALDLVQRVHDDFAGTVPAAFLARVKQAGWERSAQRLLTVTETCFDLPNPLPADPAQLRKMERFARSPRWHYTLRAAQALFGEGGRRILRAPWQVPVMAAVFARRLITPNAPREL
ncbi:nucleotidyltransferase family protein [Ancylobacter sp. FA202]|uniref:nucleotidyltransferase family protein n=1 Tax=Ancylobacter sp. FA202 TaxID=1111106 RepID=UPI001FD8C18A|nr:nucleotidyltransferase family protein [Ancylobacter sp. FA202]